MDEVRRLSSLKDAEINEAKKVLAFEVTKLVHGEEEAVKAQKAAEALFGGKGDMDAIPGVDIPEAEIAQGIKIVDLLVKAGLTPSKSEGRRAVQQGGVSVNEVKVTDVDTTIGIDAFSDGKLLLQKGKKSFCRITIK